MVVAVLPAALFGCSFDRAHLPGVPVVAPPDDPAPAADAGAPAGADAAGNPSPDTRPPPRPDARDTAAMTTDAGPPPPDTRPPDTAPPDTRPPDTALPDTRPPDTAPPPPVPAGCPVASCEGGDDDHGCCAAWYRFALDSEDRDRGLRDDLVLGFVAGGNVQAEYGFERAGQDGAVGMLLDRPRQVRSIRVTSEASGGAVGNPFVSAEGEGGKTGCAYPLSPAGLADLEAPLFCWGDNPGVSDRINIRLEATGPGTARIQVTGLQIR